MTEKEPEPTYADFTRDLLDAVRAAAGTLRHYRRWTDNMVDPDDYDRWMAELDEAADCIEALLPPESLRSSG